MDELSIEGAAARLGVSVSTVRRRIRDGLLMAERVATPQGFRYRILLPEGPAPDEPATANPNEIEALRTERDWLRSRVEELTALLNREQETSLRLSLALGQRPVIEAPANTRAPTQSDQAAPATAPQPRQERRREPLIRAWVRRWFGL